MEGKAQHKYQHKKACCVSYQRMPNVMSVLSSSSLEQKKSSGKATTLAFYFLDEQIDTPEFCKCREHWYLLRRAG